jgi:hypothetical protein
VEAVLDSETASEAYFNDAIQGVAWSLRASPRSCSG